ncbi:MAG TPA: hypothetical protein PLN21_06510 [Gemmatales bacterium]|nr:hypothetical protein [Gemmatales bacterium]
MFCSNCGVKATGNFCHACGAKLTAGESTVPAVLPLETAAPWEQELRYETLIKFPHVRKKLAELANDATTGIRAEDFLSLCDSVVKPMGPISMTKIAPMLQSMYGKLGVNTGKQRKETIPQPVGVVLFNVLCTLASGGQKIKEVSQGEDGCIIQASIPSSIWTMEGKLMITVTKLPNGTQLEAATKITGQYYDWGVSNKLLDSLYQTAKMVSSLREAA